LRRTIQREIEDPLSEKILFGELTAGQIVVVDTGPEDPLKKEGKKTFTFRGENKPTGALALDVDVPPAGITAE
jgi:ATP-dependent Clp protease ATP-binding subunit ClpC